MTRVPLPVLVWATISVWRSGVEQMGAPGCCAKAAAWLTSGVLDWPKKTPLNMYHWLGISLRG